MAGTYTPTTLSLPNGAVSVTSTDSTPYSQIQQSMGSIIYGVNTIYMFSNNSNQITQGLTFKKYDVNGNLSRNYDIPLISPYQYQNAVFYQPNDKKLAFDGQTRLNLKVLPSNQIDFVFYDFYKCYNSCSSRFPFSFTGNCKAYLIKIVSQRCAL